MRIIIAGSRSITSQSEVIRAFSEALAVWKPTQVTEIISGGAPGVDTIAQKIAEDFDIAFKEYSAEWGRYGKRAYALRNKRMALDADALVLVWDGKSSGSRMMRDIAEQEGLRIHERVVK